MALTSNIKDKDWVSARQAAAKLGSIKLGPTSTPTFAGVNTSTLTITGLTTNSLIYPVAGLLTSLGVATNGQIPIGSTGAAPVLATITQTANQVLVTNEAGSITLSTPQNIHTGASPTWVGTTWTGKLDGGSQESPIDVTNTRQYGLEFHYSGNNYSATGIRSRAQLVTTDTTATALGGLFQAANNDNINAGVLMGFMAEAVGKSTANASTITTMRGGLIGTEWGALDTVTNLKTMHLRGHSRNAAGAGSFGTGYALYIENEAVGGNGQAYDAGIYFKGTNLSGGNSAFDIGIDFRGGTYTTAEIILADGTTIGSSGTMPAHTHNTETLQHDAVNSDGGAFSFTTTGAVTFNQSIAAANYTAANLLTACATSAGGLDFSGAYTLTVGETATTTAYHTDTRAATWLAANHETTYTHADIALNTTHRGLTSGNPHSVTPTELSLLIGTNTQAWDAGLDSLAALTYVSDSFIKVTATDTYAIRTLAETKTDLSLNLVENTAHSTDAHTMSIDGVDVSVHAALNIHDAVADTTDTSCWVGLWESATGDLAPKTDGGLTYNAGTAALSTTTFIGALTGQADTVGTITGLAPDTATTQATQAGITTCANLTTVGTVGTGVWNAGAVTSSGVGVFQGASVTIGVASTTTGTLVLHDSNSANTITLTVPDVSAGSLSFTLPPTDGDNTNVLQTDGNGVLTWAAAGSGTPGGADTQVQYNNGGAFGGDATFNFNDTTKVLDVDGLTVTGTIATGLDMSGGTFATAVQNWPADPIIQSGGSPILKCDATNANLLIGKDAFQNDNGINNVGIGYQAGYNNSTTGAGDEGEDNVYIGYRAGYGATGGSDNTGQKNVALGYEALYSCTSGSWNFCLGRNAGWGITSQTYNVIIGYNAMETTGGIRCVALGSFSMRSGGGNSSIGIGYYSLNAGGGDENVAIGDYAAAALTSGGHNNIFIGRLAGRRNETGDGNVAIGHSAGQGAAGESNSNNTFIGYWSGKLITTGSDNIFLGYESGCNQTTSSDLLIVNNQDRGSVAAELTDSLVYGVFHATPASQSLRFNVGTTTWHNATHEDTDGGRTNQFNFKGQQSGGEETTLARIEVSHDGVADDQKGQIRLYTNAGSDGDAPTLQVTIAADGGIHIANLKSGTDQADAGAAAGELYQDTNDDNTIKMGV